VKETNRITGLGKSYFELLLAGYLEYVNDGKRVAPTNVFLRRFREAIETGSIDKSLRYLLESDGQLIDKVARKYNDIDNALEERWNLIPPIIVRPGNGPLSFKLSSGERLAAQDIDGHHRFFVAQLLSRPTIDAMLREPLGLERAEINTHYRL
jgi:hypothetical protein